MMRIYIILLTLILLVSTSQAQDRKVQNRPYTDLRNFHFGIQIGTHLQDAEFQNIGAQTIVDENGNEEEYLITADQDRWDPGFNVGVIGEFRLSTHAQLRIAPAIYFGSRHLTFKNQIPNEEGRLKETRQNIKSSYITSACDLIFAAPRFNNYRPYLMAGITPSLNLTGKTSDYVEFKRYQTFAEVGFGFDNYLPYFKCRPELKFMFGLGNALNADHANDMKTPITIAHARSVNKATTKMITLTFFFE